MSYPFTPDDRQNLLTSANPSITGLNDTLEANKGIIPQLDPNRFLRGGASQEANIPTLTPDNNENFILSNAPLPFQKTDFSLADVSTIATTPLVDSLTGEAMAKTDNLKNLAAEPDFTEKMDKKDKTSATPNGERKVATVDFGGLIKAAMSSPSSIPDAYVNTSKDWRAEVYKWDRGSQLKPPGKLSEATPTSNFLGGFNLGSNSQKGLKFNWGNGSPNGNSKFPIDNFVIKTYTDTEFQANKTYKFRARGDDGFRLFARPLNKPDAWELITPITDTSINPDTRPWWQEQYGNPKEYEFKPKDGGTYRVVALFYDRDSNANFDLSWKEVSSYTQKSGPGDILSLSKAQQQQRLGINLSSVYYQPKGNKFAKGNGTSGSLENLWCTDYAFGRALEKGLIQANSGIGSKIWGNAGFWDDHLPQDYRDRLGTQPKPNSFVILDPWTAGTKEAGHVRFVEEVYTDGSFLISESNWDDGDQPRLFHVRHIKPGTSAYTNAKFIYL